MKSTSQGIGAWKVMVVPALREAVNLDLLDACIVDEGPNETIFLGGYFDRASGNEEPARRMARWLKRSVSQPRRIHLMGPDDLPYLGWIGHSFPGAGCTELRGAAVREVLGPMAYLHFHLTWWEGAWLFSRGGLSATRFPAGLVAPHGVKRYLDAELRSAMRARREGQAHWLWSGTGDADLPGGSVVRERGEFRPVRGINQVFCGHSGRMGDNGSINYAFGSMDRAEEWSAYLLLYPETNTLRHVNLSDIEALSDGG